MAVDITGQVALITGASRGIGEHCALALAREGCSLALTARDAARLERVAARCRQLGARTLCLPADAADDAALDGLVERCITGLGGLNLLVNNAGVWHEGLAQESELGHWDEMLSINLRSVMRLTRLALPHIIAGCQGGPGRGVVILIASMSGIRTYSGGAGYCATKFGVVGFSKALWDDVAELGVKVSAICPGWVNTDMAVGSGLDRQKMIQPEDVAELVRMVATWPGTSCPKLIELMPQHYPR